MNKADDTSCSYGDFMRLLPLCAEEHKTELIARLQEQPRPETLCGKDVPESLNAISYGILDDLQSAAEAADPFVDTCMILLGVTRDDVSQEDVNDVFGFMSFVTKELQRINKLFASIKPTYSNEEKQAGIESLNFGAFGVLDWYAQRMHIANQNEVRDVAWIRIWQCMKMDKERNEFERRLSKVYNKKKR